MIIIGHGKSGANIVTATDEELLRIIGSKGSAVTGMFKVGKQINVSEQWDKLQYFIEHAEPLKNIVSELRNTADAIETASGELK